MPNEIKTSVDLNKAELLVGDVLKYKIESWILDLQNFIDRALKEGLSEIEVKNLLLTDLANEGRLFGALKNGMKHSITEAISLASREATLQVFDQSGIKEFRWITVSANPCRDCIARHGRVEPMEKWRNIGFPKSGFSVCRGFCKCRLVPKSYKGISLENPVLLKKKKKS